MDEAEKICGELQGDSQCEEQNRGGGGDPRD
jgi:hypothetical protein